jgi:hypothetical protein
MRNFSSVYQMKQVPIHLKATCAPHLHLLAGSTREGEVDFQTYGLMQSHAVVEGFPSASSPMKGWFNVGYLEMRVISKRNLKRSAHSQFLINTYFFLKENGEM